MRLPFPNVRRGLTFLEIFSVVSFHGASTAAPGGRFQEFSGSRNDLYLREPDRELNGYLYERDGPGRQRQQYERHKEGKKKRVLQECCRSQSVLQ